jgi:hypothetical protein
MDADRIRMKELFAIGHYTRVKTRDASNSYFIGMIKGCDMRSFPGTIQVRVEAESGVQRVFKVRNLVMAQSLQDLY